MERPSTKARQCQSNLKHMVWPGRAFVLPSTIANDIAFSGYSGSSRMKKRTSHSQTSTRFSQARSRQECLDLIATDPYQAHFFLQGFILISF